MSTENTPQLSWAALIRHCVAVIDSYDGLRVTRDAHMDAYADSCRASADSPRKPQNKNKKPRSRATTPSSSSTTSNAGFTSTSRGGKRGVLATRGFDFRFVQQVLYGVDRFHGLLKVGIDGLYGRYSAFLSRTDRTFYTSLLYVILFMWGGGAGARRKAGRVLQPDELTLSNAQCKKLLVALPVHKVETFCSFFYDKEMFDGWIEEHWSAVYDRDYVRGKLIPRLSQGVDTIRSILCDITVAEEHKLQQKQGVKTLERVKQGLEPITVVKLARDPEGRLKTVSTTITVPKSAIDQQPASGSSEDRTEDTLAHTQPLPAPPLPESVMHTVVVEYENGQHRILPRVTKPQPFDLTPVKPKILSLPATAIPARPVQTREVPSTCYGAKLKGILEQKETRRLRALDTHKQFYEEVSREFRFASDQRISKHQQQRVQRANEEEAARRAQQEAERKKRERLQQVVLPRTTRTVREARDGVEAVVEEVIQPVTPTEVRRTLAQVVRDEAVFAKQRKEEAERLKRFEAELKDDSAWVAAVREAEVADEQAEAERLRALKRDLQLGIHKVRRVLTEELSRKQEAVAAARSEAQVRAAAKVRQAVHQKTERAQRAVKQRSELRKARIQAQERVAEAKVAVVQREKRAAERRAQLVRQRQAAELAEKRELIHKIQAMEALANARALRPKEFDPTTSGGHGLLTDMSLVELRERLHLLKVRREQELRARKTVIAQHRRDKQEVIRRLEARHQRLRKNRAVTAAERRTRHLHEQQAHAAQAEKVREEGEKRVEAFVKKQQRKKLARALALADELRVRQREVAHMQARKAVSKRRFQADMARASQRTSFSEAQQAKEAVTRAVVKATVAKQTRVNRKTKLQRTRQVQAARRVREAQHMHERQEVIDFQQTIRQEQVARMREERAAVQAYVRAQKPYATKVADRCLRRVKRTQQAHAL